MSVFSEDVRLWNELMCIEENSRVLQRFGIAQIREDRVLDLTKRYIHALAGIQQRHDEVSSTFASKVRRRVDTDMIGNEVLERTCNGFLAGIDATLLRLIPPAKRRSQRSGTQTLIISWHQDTVDAMWEGIEPRFSLRSLLLVCAEHSGGADEVTSNAIVDQLLDDLRSGTATIPRFRLICHNSEQSILLWGKAVVSLPEDVAVPLVSVADAADQGPLVTTIEDSGLQFDFEIHECMADEDTRYLDTLNTETILAIDDAAELQESDATLKKLEGLVMRATQRGENAEQLVEVMANSAIKGVTAGIAVQQQENIENRIAVFKGLKKIRKTRKFGKRELELA